VTFAASGPWAIVGLGNPGAKYAQTRHNIGAMVIARMAASESARMKVQRRLRCELADVRVAGTRVMLAVPGSFMNESGGPVAALTQFYKIPTDQLILVQDEVDLPFGALRVKFGGGDNGHNGLRSVRSSLGSGDWYRVRMGVGRPTGRADTAGHVLARFSGAERKQLPEFLDRGSAAAVSLMENGLAATQSEFNS
jgi:PTH1 family peptidyl-tRNA hydrolase